MTWLSRILGYEVVFSNEDNLRFRQELEMKVRCEQFFRNQRDHWLSSHPMHVSSTVNAASRKDSS